MDEHELQTLGREPLGPTVVRPVDQVLRRGRRLHHRAVAVRAVPVVAVGALLATAGVLSGQRDPAPDVSTDPTEQELPVKYQFCDQPDPEPVPAEDLAGLRLVPTELPSGVAVGELQPTRQVTGTCVEFDPALVLRAGGEGGTVEAEIRLEGPLGEPYEGGDGVQLEPTQLRGRDAARASDPTAPGSYVGFAWTEPDGASWFLNGVGVDEATLRAVAEALELRSSPGDDEAAAALPESALPTGFAVTWQAQGLPRVESAARLEWRVTTTPPSPGPGCEVRIETTALEAPPGRLFSATNGAVAFDDVEVRGTRGFAVEEIGNAFLEWQEAPGVVGHVTCPGDLDTVLTIAGSLVEVDADDPRIVGG